ncbi:pyruvate ferredoxin oxidoreductase [Candidatus Bipolaricaulota bacterium]|nr:pyruvate ferredoxin oxidoreductase [Candidatus Bipolaricaulota bacterium]MBS3814491.1 pyruvate ferredoxin oxidoreductase [Candidatus Bipolaricaulota bacterium]MBS3825459.1 pyruvate ferredoxin oxidoreductase [Candidatus Bipolaricaulota bacterium]
MSNGNKDVLTGHQVVANAMRQVEPDVVAAYPITPQSEIVEYFSQFVADGEVDSEVITVESEHSAMSACVGSAAAGARTMTATASQGLALMMEIVYIAASMRTPIVMTVANRALSGPINIHCDHSDSMAARDSGVIQLYGEDAQEAYEFTLMAQRLAESEDVLLPVMVTLDGFTLTHTAQVAELLPDESVKEFVGEYEARYPLLDVENPTTQGPFDMPDYYFEHKLQQVEAMSNVPDRFLEVQDEFNQLSGSNYDGLFDSYKLDDADYAVVILGSTAGTAKVVVDQLREQGKKVGLLKPWLFRPFPEEKISKALRDKEAVGVLDRSLSFGSSGPLYLEVSSALSEEDNKPRLYNYTYGLGGRDIKEEQIAEVFEDLEDPDLEHEMRYIGARQ